MKDRFFFFSSNKALIVRPTLNVGSGETFTSQSLFLHNSKIFKSQLLSEQDDGFFYGTTDDTLTADNGSRKRVLF